MLTKLICQSWDYSLNFEWILHHLTAWSWFPTSTLGEAIDGFTREIVLICLCCLCLDRAARWTQETLGISLGIRGTGRSFLESERCRFPLETPVRGFLELASFFSPSFLFPGCFSARRSQFPSNFELNS